jgi:curved DNA-binding protein CbpA
MSAYTDDAYAVLGVQPNATDAEIKKQYRKLALVHHPDRHQDLVKKEMESKIFAAIANAYEVLTDEYLRAEYDRAQRERSAVHVNGTNKGGSNGTYQDEPPPFRYHFSDPYEVFKRDFRSHFGIEYPGAQYDWVAFDTPTSAPAPNNKLLLNSTSGNTNTKMIEGAPDKKKKGLNLFRRRNNKDKKAENVKDSSNKANSNNTSSSNQLVVRNPTAATSTALATTNNTSALANGGSDNSRALVKVDKKNNRPVSMDVESKTEGKITTTVTTIVRPDGTVERVTMKTGIPGPDPKKKNKPLMLTNGDGDKKMLTNGAQKTLRALTNGNSKNAPQLKGSANNTNKALLTNGARSNNDKQQQGKANAAPMLLANAARQ